MEIVWSDDHRWSPMITDPVWFPRAMRPSHGLTRFNCERRTSCQQLLTTLWSILEVPHINPIKISQIKSKSNHQLKTLLEYPWVTRDHSIWWDMVISDIMRYPCPHIVNSIQCPTACDIVTYLYIFPILAGWFIRFAQAHARYSQPHTHLGVLHLVQSMYLSVHLQTRHGKVSMTKDTLGWQAADLKQTSQHPHKAVVRRSLEYANHRKSISNVSYKYNIYVCVHAYSCILKYT